MKNIIISICAVIAIAIATTSYFLLQNKNNEIVDKQKNLTEITYDASGDMNGNYYNVELVIKDKTLIVKEKDNYNDPLVVKEYSVTDKDIQKIKDYINKYDYPKYSKYKNDETLFVYDAAQKDITFTYNNKRLEWYKVSFEAKLNSDERKALNEFTKYFLSLVKEDNLIKEYIEENN